MAVTLWRHRQTCSKTGVYRFLSSGVQASLINGHALKIAAGRERIYFVNPLGVSHFFCDSSARLEQKK
jgi:hypothetical protein